VIELDVGREEARVLVELAGRRAVVERGERGGIERGDRDREIVLRRGMGGKGGDEAGASRSPGRPR